MRTPGDLSLLVKSGVTVKIPDLQKIHVNMFESIH